MIAGTPIHGGAKAVTKLSTWVVLAAATLLLASCTVGPNYHRPQIAVPTRWSEPLSGGETNGPPDFAEWWKAFRDPELDSLVQRAARANLDLRIAQYRVQEARAERGVTAAGYWPMVNASSSYTRNRISQHYFLPLPPGTPLTYNWYQAGFDASWELDLFGGTRRAVEAANADVEAAEFARRDTLISLLAELARNYFEARGTQQRLIIAQQNIAAQRDSLDLTRARYNAGLSSDLDVQQATALLDNTQAQIPLLQTTLKSALHRIGILLGEAPGAASAELAQPAVLPGPPPEVPVGLPSDLLLRRPDLQRAERELAAATARVGVAKADLFPKFSLTGNGGVQSVSASDWFTAGSRFWTFGPTVAWRIFDAGRIRANIHVQTAREKQSLASYEQTVLTAFEEVENALTAYAQEQLRYRSLNASATAQRAALTLSQDLYRNGLVDFLRVLDSERSLYVAEDELVQSHKTVSEDLIALYKALGGGWDSTPGQSPPE
jgi:multidrug efflux system outer membrane protein